MPATVFDFSKPQAITGKFVVLKNADDEENRLVVFSDFSLDFQHADIVRRWRRAHAGGLAEAGFHVDGGGWWKRTDDGTLVLYGSSAAYGRFDRVWIEQNLAPELMGAVAKILVE